MTNVVQLSDYRKPAALQQAAGPEPMSGAEFGQQVEMMSHQQRLELLAVLRAQWPMHRRDPKTAAFLNALAKWIFDRAAED